MAAAEVLFPIIHPHAARAIKTGEGVAEYDQKHVRAAEALFDAGVLASGEVEWGVEIGSQEGRTVVRMHPNTEREAKRWAALHPKVSGGPAIVVRRRLAGPWTVVKEVS